METIIHLPARIWAFINRDVKSENETKKISVILRLYTLIVCAYLVCQEILLIPGENWGAVFLGMLFFALYIVCFILTYRQRTTLAVNLSLWMTVLWIILYVYLMGWDGGAQHFLFVVLIFICTTSHRTAGYKISLASVLCALRIALYIWGKSHNPVYALTPTTVFLFQIINTIAIFAVATAIILIFGMDNMAMEKKLMDYNDKVLKMASVDPLTRLYNRRAISSYLEKLVKTSQRDGTGFTLAIGDIDFFKKVNDTYGHEAGDEVLRTVSELFLGFMADKGRPSRWGGEEFLLVFENANGDEVFVFLEQLRRKLEKKTITYKELDIKITMTFGVEEYDFSSDIERCINRADEKLYMGKASGRNKVVF